MTETTCAVALRKREIKALLRIAGKNDVRYYLNGVCLDFDRRVLVATDGHMLLVFRPDEMTGTGQAIVPRAALESALRIPTPNDRKRTNGPPDVDITVSGTGQRDVAINVNGIAVTTKEFDGRYPDFVKVAPRKLSGEPGHYNPAYLTAMSASLSDLAGRRYAFYPALVHNGTLEDSGAGVMYEPTLNSAFGVIMPMRLDASPADAIKIIDSLVPTPAKEKQPAKRKCA